MATIEHIRDYKVKSDDRFFFDNNVWMFLYSSGISGSHSYEQRIYSTLFRNIKSARATVFINALVASEYVNTNLRLGFNQWKKLPENLRPNIDYKRDYRPTASFKEHQEAVYAELDDILKSAERKPDDFNAIQPEQILSSIGKDMDFNDAYYVSYCHLNHLILVTNDKDLLETETDIRILTK